MTDTKKGEIGYRRPPKATQWKKGQTGNPRKVRGRRRKKVWQIIEEILAKKITVTESGQKRLVTALEAILHQLFAKASSGNGAAVRALAKYRTFAKSKPDTYVIKEEVFDETQPSSFVESLKVTE